MKQTIITQIEKDLTWILSELKHHLSELQYANEQKREKLLPLIETQNRTAEMYSNILKNLSEN